MSVHYKFKSALDYDTVTFDGLHISVGDLKAAISQQKRIGKTSDFDLQITNAQTKEVYVDDNTLIPKNTSLLVARVPLAQLPKKQWDNTNNNTSTLHKDVAPNKGVADLSRMEGSEQDKINAMISQSTFDYDPSNYQKIRGQNQRGAVPPNYICYKCQKRGHWIKDCPAANSGDPVEIRRSTGIPRSFMVPVEGPKAPGAMMTPSGTFAVPAVDHEAYLASENAGGGDTPTNAPAAPEPNIPDELICSLCRDLLTDAVMIPCCGNSFCDECIRGALLESEDHECPDCREKEIVPTTLIPNRFLRNSVSSFRNQTGYSRRTPHRPSAAPVPARPPVLEHVPPAQPQQPPNGPNQPQDPTSNGPPLNTKHNVDNNPHNIPMNMQRVDEQRASTPTVDERRDPMSSQMVYNRGPPHYLPGMPPPSRYEHPYGRPPPFNERYPPETYQPPPPGIKDSPSHGMSEDPLEAFNRMIREKEMRAKRREEERRRAHSAASRSRSRSRSRTPRSVRSPRSPHALRGTRSPRSPRARPRSRASSRIRYSRSRSMSRGRIRRSPWSPRRRRSRDRSLSLTRSPSPRRRHRSPLRYRSPLRSPGPRSPLRSPLRTPLRSPGPRSPLRSPRRSPPQPRPMSPNRPMSPHRPMSPPHRPISPHRYVGVYDELLSPPRRSVEPPYGPRYASRSNVPPPIYPPGGVKSIPPLGNISLQSDQGPGYRNRYDAHPFEDIPPGIEPPVPGFEPSPFEKPPFSQPGPMDRERLPISNYRDPYRGSSYVEGPSSYRDMPIPPISNEIPVHVGDQSRYRDNFRPGPYRDQSAAPFRDGQPYREVGLTGAYRDPNFRGGPPPFRENSYRNIPYREGGFREHPHNNFRESGMPYRPPSADPRESTLPSLLDTNYRDNFRDDGVPSRDHNRPGFRPNVRGRIGPRRNPNVEHDRHRDREGRDRDRDRYNENRDPSERPERVRDVEKRSGHEKTREGREERQRDFEKNKEYEKERDNERTSPDKRNRVSPKRSRDIREKKRSESKDRSRDHERDSRRDKKEERNRDKTSADRNRDHKDKEKKLKERKKKKREKEKDLEKKKKREKKEKKEKDVNKREDEDTKTETKNDENKSETTGSELQNVAKSEKLEQLETIPQKEVSPKPNSNEKLKNHLYDEEAAEAVDKEIIQNYVKNEDIDTTIKKNVQNMNLDEPFDGIELQINTDELDLKPETEITTNKEMLAPMPELSKWEVEEESVEKSKEPGEITSPEEEENSGKVTSDVIKRAENAIFAKAINSLRPIEIKKISSDRLKLYGDEQPKLCMNNIQITVPVVDNEIRPFEINDKKKRHSKTPPPRLSVKDRLGGKVTRVVHSTVERVKSRSKTPKKEQPYRRVTVEKERGRKQDAIEKSGLSKTERNIQSEGVKVEKHHSSSVKRDSDKTIKIEKTCDSRELGQDKNDQSSSKTPNIDRERKKSTLDEAHFEPDYDENVDSDTEMKDESVKKRERPISPSGREQIDTKKPKIDTSSIKFDLTNVKKKPDTESDTSSDSEFSSSSSSSDARKRKKKKKRTKKKKKRAASDSDSESGSSSDDHKKKKKKRKHKKKSSKKKKKSKHK